MPTKKELQQKINELEKQIECDEFEKLIIPKVLEAALNFIKAVNLDDIFYKNLDTPGRIVINIDELKEAINKIKCPHCENCCSCKNKN